MSNTSERRDGPRLDLRLRVRYAADDLVAHEAEASDVSPHGLRLESDAPVAAGTALRLSVDDDDDARDELMATGTVTWCRPRASPTGKPQYDVGVRFNEDWLARERGPLGRALARVFAMGGSEPARSWDRTPVSLMASIHRTQLRVADLSFGGMQLRAPEGLPASIQVNARLEIAIELPSTTGRVQGRVAWVAGAKTAEGAPRVSDSFGVEFVGLHDVSRAMLDDVRVGRVEPLQLLLTLL